MNEGLLEIIKDALQEIEKSKVTFFDENGSIIKIDYEGFVTRSTEYAEDCLSCVDDWEELEQQQSKIKYIDIPNPTHNLFNAFDDLMIMYDDDMCFQAFHWDCSEPMLLERYCFDDGTNVWIDLKGLNNELKRFYTLAKRGN